MSEFRLEPTTPNTVICNQSALRRAKEYIRTIDDASDFDIDHPEQWENYPLTDVEHADVKPYLVEWLAAWIEAQEKISDVLDSIDEWAVEYHESDDYLSGLAYCARESDWGPVDDWVEKHVSTLDLPPMSAEHRIAFIADCIAGAVDVDIEFERGHMYSSASNCLVDVWSYPIGEIEQQIEYREIEEQIGSDVLDSNDIRALITWCATVKRDHCLRLSQHDRDCFYLFTLSDTVAIYGPSIDALTDMVDEKLTALRDEIANEPIPQEHQERIFRDMIEPQLPASYGLGFCVNCGAERECCEPDAREYPCEECERNAVYGAEELLFMFVA